MVPADSRRVSRAPRYLGATGKYDGIFIYGAVTLYGRPFQTVLLTPPSPSFNQGTEPDPPPLLAGLDCAAMTGGAELTRCGV